MLIFGIFYLKGSEKKYLFQSYQAVLSEIKFSNFFFYKKAVKFQCDQLIFFDTAFL